MNSIPWYRSTVLTTALLAFFTQISTMFDATFINDLLERKPGALARAIAASLTGVVIAVRAVASTQPVTLTQASADAANKQAGFARPLLLAFLFGTAVLALPVLQGCQFLGVTQPKTFRDEYAYSLAQVTAIRKTATDLLTTKQISAADAEYVLKTSDQARTYLDTARSVYEAGDSVKGQTGLQLVTNVLLQLQTFLNARSP